jgi:hypothetical protein
VIGGPAKNVQFATPGRSVNVYIERHADVTQEQFESVLRGIEASDIKELVPGILAAKIDSLHLQTLKQVADVSIMDEKSPKA